MRIVAESAVVGYTHEIKGKGIRDICMCDPT